MIWTVNRIVALVLGIIFTLIGLLGFFIAPGMVKGNLLGFDVDMMHNTLHLLTGILGLVAAFTGWSRTYNQVFGTIYVLLGLAGLIYPVFYFKDLLLGIMHANALDHVLHLITGVVACTVGYGVTSDYDIRSTRPTST